MHPRIPGGPNYQTRFAPTSFRQLGLGHSHQQTTDLRFMKQGQFWKKPPPATPEGRTATATAQVEPEEGDKGRLKSLMVLEIKV